MCLPIIKNYCKLLIGLFLIALGISSLIYTPVDFLFDIRLRMIPGTPFFDLWFNPPKNIIMKTYIFNITNSERFLNGSDDELHLQEIGPIIFRDDLSHSNTVFNSNSTLTYSTTRRPIYLPERNTININDTVLVPNLAVIALVAYLQDYPFLVKTSVNMLLNRYKSQAIVKTTIYNYLLNMTDPVLSAAQMFTGKRFLPSTNIGCLTQMYINNKHNVTVFIGPKYSHRDYFLITNIDGLEAVPGYKRCTPKFINTSELSLFPQFLGKEDVRAWRYPLCRIIDAKFTNESRKYGMKERRYDVPLTLFDRTEPSYLDCYKGFPPLPNGLSDMSSCYKGLPFVLSFPRFLNADPIVSKRLKGLNPNKEKHVSFLILEGMSGVPIGGRASLQVNLRINKLTGFNYQIRRFSNIILPLSYVEFVIEELPWHYLACIYLMTVIVPYTQLIMSMGFLIGGFIYFYFVQLKHQKHNDKKLLAGNEFNESENFL